MTCAYLAFTSKGLALARKLAAAQPGAVARCGENGVTLANWTAAQFAQSDALVFVGAVGIAVRAIAPHCRSKATDPAVISLDELGKFVIPILSGHIGGANALAARLADALGATPVITTATDINLTKFCCLECNIAVIKNLAYLCHVFCICIIGTGFSSCSCKFVKNDTTAKICCIFLFEALTISRVIACAYVRRKHKGIAECSAKCKI